MIFQQLTHLPA